MNRISPDEVLTTPAGELAALASESLFQLKNDAADLLAAAKAIVEHVDRALDLKYADRAHQLRLAAGKSKRPFVAAPEPRTRYISPNMVDEWMFDRDGTPVTEAAEVYSRDLGRVAGALCPFNDLNVLEQIGGGSNTVALQQLPVAVQPGLGVRAFKLDDQQPHESKPLARVEDRAEDGVVGALGPDPTSSLATLRGHTVRERLV